MSILVSIIIPFYNRRAVMGNALKSVLNQTYKNWELYIIDDGSTLPFELEPKFKDPRIKILHHSTNQGAAAARNTGIKHAKGKYIAFLDTDDIWFPEKVEKQVAFLEKSGPHIGGCVTACHLIYSNKREVRYVPIQDFYHQSLRGEHLSAGSTLMFKKECLDKVGLQNTDLPRLEDWEWQINFSKHYDWVSLPDILATIHIHTIPNYKDVKKSIQTLQKRMVFKNSRDAKTFQIRCLYEICIASFLEKKYTSCIYYTGLMGLRSPKYLGKKFLEKIL